MKRPGKIAAMTGWFWHGKRKWISLAVLLAVAGGAVYAMQAGSKQKEQPKNQGPKPLEFISSELTTVKKVQLAQALAVSGSLMPARMVTVRARASGEIKQLSLREGDRVSQGQVLALIDASEVRARFTQAEGTVVQTKAALEIAQKNRANNERLLNQNFISKNAFDSADSNYVQALGNYKTAQGQLEVARIALAETTVRAPMSGVINKRHVQAGDKVAFDGTLFTLVDVSKLELNATVPTSDIANVQVGMPVTLSIEGASGKPVTGQVDRIAASAEPGTRAIAIVVSIPNPDQQLRGGLFASGTIQTAPTHPLNGLPIASLRQEGTDYFVWAFDGSKLVKQKVQVGRRDDTTNTVEILNALNPSMQVLAGKYDGLKEGTSAVLVKERVAGNEQGASAAMPKASSVTPAQNKAGG